MVRTAVRTVGELFVTVGVVLLLFVVYELWITGLYTDREQSQLLDQLQDRWDAPAGAPAAADSVDLEDVALGEGLAVLRVPRFGPDYHPVVVEGVGRDDLQRGPGHIPETALPGEVGNFVVSGHRTTYGAPFNRLDELQPGDPLVVETADRWFTYRVTESRIVQPTAIEVTYPVPGQEGAQPTERLLTLTTCHPEYSARERLIVHAVLADETPRAAGPPSVLAG